MGKNRYALTLFTAPKPLPRWSIMLMGDPCSILLEKIETLYQTILADTQASADETDIDKQIAIEAIRKDNLERIDLILKEIVQFFSIEKTAQVQVNEDAFLQQKERLLLLVDQIRSIDIKKTELIEREQSAIVQALQSISLGKQAVKQYQKTMP